jgi:hypothetical protein
MDEQQSHAAGGLPPAGERPVFLAASGRRRLALRVAAQGSALLTAGWLACMVVGSVGFLHLPRIGLPVRGMLAVHAGVGRATERADRDVGDRDEPARCASGRVRVAAVALPGRAHAAVDRDVVPVRHTRSRHGAERCDLVRV